jgi:hypothetical protein
MRPPSSCLSSSAAAVGHRAGMPLWFVGWEVYTGAEMVVA